jgi:hypothetical protein
MYFRNEYFTFMNCFALTPRYDSEYSTISTLSIKAPPFLNQSNNTSNLGDIQTTNPIYRTHTNKNTFIIEKNNNNINFNIKKKISMAML